MLPFWLLLFLALAGPHPTDPAEASGAPARAAFERFKALQGTWRGVSTRGWAEDVTFRVIAAGSAVVETSFDAHPGETMLTLFAMDGERLRLTHYCVAGNQPRLEAATFEDGGKTVGFVYVDGGNLPSRDRGHMDRAVFHFEDADHATTRWTWHQDGTDRWMEEIRLTRKN